jgi:DNA mismatch endonuclease, patch repair protein
MNTADIFSPEKRSQIMSRVRAYDTKPELVVRSLVHNMGFRFRLYREDLPGNPDIVLPRHKKVIFVHGCFWHGHKKCKRANRPSTNVAFWQKKLDGNIARDKRNQAELTKRQWKCLVIWQCEIGNGPFLKKKIGRFLTKREKK